MFVLFFYANTPLLIVVIGFLNDIQYRIIRLFCCCFCCCYHPPSPLFFHSLSVSWYWIQHIMMIHVIQCTAVIQPVFSIIILIIMTMIDNNNKFIHWFSIKCNFICCREYWLRRFYQSYSMEFCVKFWLHFICLVVFGDCVMMP